MSCGYSRPQHVSTSTESNRAAGIIFIVAVEQILLGELVLKAKSQVKKALKSDFLVFFQEDRSFFEKHGLISHLGTKSLSTRSCSLHRISQTEGYRQHLHHARIVVQLPAMGLPEVVPIIGTQKSHGTRLPRHS